MTGLTELSFSYRERRREVPDELELVKNVGREIAEPKEASVNRARMLLQRRIDAVDGVRKRRWRPLHVRWALAGVVAVLLASGFGFGLGAWNTSEGSAKTSLVGLGFLPAGGWTVLQSTPVGQKDAASAVAANVPLRSGNDLRATARATAASLPAKGVLIFATFTLRGDPADDAGFTRRDLPLSLRLAAIGPESTDRRIYRLRAGVEGYNVDAQVSFGSASPSAETLEVAQRQLNRLVVAAEPVTILARSTILGPYDSVTLIGSIDSDKADEIVNIQAKDCRQQSFRGVAAARTRQGGGWSSEYWPGISTTLRAVWNDAASSEITVRRQPLVNLRKRTGRQLEVMVVSQANFWRKRVLVQRFDRRLGTWATVKSVVLTETGAAGAYARASARFSTSLPGGTLVRAFFPLSQARPCYLAGVSPQLRT